MSNLFIKRIKIQNFKLIKFFDEEFNSQLVILDGPNGFGKTSIFDAIELVIYGKIRRIDEYNIVDKRQTFRDSLYFNNPLQDVLIQIEFEKKGETFVITKRLDAKIQQDRSVKENAPHKWEFETYISENFIENFDKVKPVTHQKVLKKIGNDTLMRAYHLFYYIQQEEKTFFLKRKEKERLDELSTLFDTKKEQEELEKYKNIQGILRRKIKELGDEEVEIQKQITEGNTLLQVNKDSDLIENYTFKPLFQYIPNTIPEWDKELSSLDQESREKIMKDLDFLKTFISHFESYKKILFNKKVKEFLEDDNLLKQTVIISSFLDSEEKFNKRFSNQQKLNALKIKLEDDKILQTIEAENAAVLLKDLKQYGIQYDEDEIENKISKIKEHRKNASQLSSLVIDLNQTRNSFYNKFKDFVDKSDNKEGTCPFCGHDWDSFEVLLTSIDEKRKYFEDYYDSSAKQADDLINELQVKNIHLIRLQIEDLLKEQQNQIKENFYGQFKNYLVGKNNVKKFIEWCNSINKDIFQYVNDIEVFISQENLSQYTENLKKELMKLIIEIPDDIFEEEEIIPKFENVYKDYFQNDEAYVKELTFEAIDEKKQYINAVYYWSNHDKIQKLIKSQEQLTIKQGKLESYLTRINKIVTIYDQSIRQHWSRIINDIEIVFFVYCGKIIQYYQRGLGMFIRQGKENDQEAKAIRFVSGPDTDHDAILYLSSGQLSALVISFTLALNKVYGKDGLNVILIDDPVQTMDDINMASFSELLRNDFADKQIVLSTHEDHITRYLGYKYMRYGLDWQPISMKEKFLIS